MDRISPPSSFVIQLLSLLFNIILLSLLFNITLKTLARGNKEQIKWTKTKETNEIQIAKEEVKLSLFTEGIILDVENPKEFPPKGGD